MTQIAAVAKSEASLDDPRRSRTGNQAIHNSRQTHTGPLHSNDSEATWNHGSEELADCFRQGLADCGMAGSERVRPETCRSFGLQCPLDVEDGCITEGLPGCPQGTCVPAYEPVLQLTQRSSANRQGSSRFSNAPPLPNARFGGYRACVAVNAAIHLENPG